MLGRDEVVGASGQPGRPDVIYTNPIQEITTRADLVFVSLVVPPIDGIGFGTLQFHQRFQGGLDMGFEGGDVEGFPILLSKAVWLIAVMTIVAKRPLIITIEEEV